MTIRNIRRASVLFGVSILTACGGGGLNDLSAQSIKLSIQNEAPLSACVSGGVTVNSGVDTNLDFVLQNTEVTGTQYICNGKNGIAGLSGFNGLAGTSGLSALVVVSQELPGTHCTTGGTRVSAGFDANRDSALNASEVTSSSFICNGFNGGDGVNGNLGATGAAGTNGTAGPTGAAGANGTTGATGATGTNGTTGAAGANGTVGATGVAGTNGVTGATGAAGSNGATGATGFKSLVTIVTELPGIHCLSGGVVAKSGVDSNSNNSLDPLEVTSTSYICNGERGATGPTGATGSTGGTGAQGATGATGPAGGGLSAYGYIYALIRQDVAIDAAVLFDAQSDLVNIENRVGSSDIGILENGNYLVGFSVTGTEPNQFAIFVNGTVVPGSIYGSGAGTQQNNGQVIVRLEKGDTVTLVNYHSAAAVGLQSLSGGSEENVTASVTLLKLN
jgi:hypothetical protein